MRTARDRVRAEFVDVSYVLSLKCRCYGCSAFVRLHVLCFNVVFVNMGEIYTSWRLLYESDGKLC